MAAFIPASFLSLTAHYVNDSLCSLTLSR